MTITNEFEQLTEYLQRTHRMFTISHKIPRDKDNADEINADEERQRQVLIHKDMRVRDVTLEAVRKLIDTTNDAKYVLSDHQGVLDEDLPVKQLTSTQLILSREDHTSFQKAQQQSRPMTLRLREVESQTVFEVKQFPAKIGRVGKNGKPDDLSVDLGGMEKANMVSREHAEIRQDGDALSVVKLSQHNKVIVNNDVQVESQPHVLHTGDTLLIGEILFNIEVI